MTRAFDDAVEIVKPLPDSQYRLRPCKCGSSEVVYAQYIGTANDGHPPTETGYLWRVVCTECGAVVDIQSTIRHPVQIEWNRRNNHGK